jgi:hypothetical protein
MTRRDGSVLTNAGSLWLAPEPGLFSLFLKEVIKWNIAVLANGVVTRRRSRRAATTNSSHPTRDHFVRSASNGLAVEMHLGLDRQVFFYRVSMMRGQRSRFLDHRLRCRKQSVA